MLVDGNGAPDWRVAKRAAFLEVFAAFYMIVEMFTRRRNLILLVIYWQYMQMRYMLEKAVNGPYGGPLGGAFGDIDASVTRFVNRPACPSPVKASAARSRHALARRFPSPDRPPLLAPRQTVYETLKTMIDRQVALPKPGEKRTPRCSVM